MSARLDVRGHRLVLYGAPRHSPVIASLPAARWLNKYSCWVFPRSPLALARLHKALRSLGTSYEASPAVDDLWREWERVQAARTLKTAPSADGIKWLARTTPRPYQALAKEFARGRSSAYLALDVGLGKTMTALELILEQRPATTLVLCPKTVRDVWAAEAIKHLPARALDVVVLDKGTSVTKRDAALEALAGQATIGRPLAIVVNYDTAWRLPLGKALADHEWDMIIADEAQRLKAAGSKVSRWAAKLRADVKLGLSGTPFPNNKLDAYGQFRFLDPSYFGSSFARFRATYAVMGGYDNHQILGWKNEDKFNRLIDLMMYRVDQSELDLPDEIDLVRSVELPPKALRMMRDLAEDFMTEVDGGVVTAANALGKLMKLRTVSAGFIRDEDGVDHLVHQARREALREVLEEIGPDEPVVVFAEFRHDLAQIHKLAKRMGRPYAEVSGRTNALVGGRLPPAARVIGVQPRSGGEGVNLQDSHYCVFFNLSYSLGAYQQCRGRLQRTGQKHSVRFIHLIAGGTIDTVVMSALRSKHDVIEQILDYVKAGGKIA